MAGLDGPKSVEEGTGNGGVRNVPRHDLRGSIAGGPTPSCLDLWVRKVSDTGMILSPPSPKRRMGCLRKPRSGLELMADTSPANKIL